MKRAFLICLVLLGNCVQRTVRAQESPTAERDIRTSALPNVATPTFGGTQLWSDEFILRGWRIQRHALSGHYRLLDDNNTRIAWGSYEQCQQRLQESRRKNPIEPEGGKVVLLLHGLGATRHSMEGLGKYLEKEGKYSVINVSYASTRAPLATHARSLAKVIEGLKEATEISFVAHSLGNLVVRQYLTDPQQPGFPGRPDPRVHRFVMLGPPNNGAQWGTHFKDWAIFEPVVGKSAAQASVSSVELSRMLATPRCEFAIIAGGQGNRKGLNPLVSGDDDLVIGVEETRLAGARDFTVVPVIHRWLMDDEKVREYTLQFLRYGYFTTDAARHAIP